MRLTLQPHIVPKVLGNIRVKALPTLRACVAYKKGENLFVTNGRNQSIN